MFEREANIPFIPEHDAVFYSLSWIQLVWRDRVLVISEHSLRARVLGGRQGWLINAKCALIVEMKWGISKMLRSPPDFITVFSTAEMWEFVFFSI